MDNSIISIISKLLENKELLNIATSLFSCQKQTTNNSSSPASNYNNKTNPNNLPLYPEPLFYPDNNQPKKEEKNQVNQSFLSNLSNDLPSLLSSLSNINLSDLISKISPLLSLTNSLTNSNKENKKSTTSYGASDIDLDKIIRSD